METALYYSYIRKPKVFHAPPTIFDLPVRQIPCFKLTGRRDSFSFGATNRIALELMKESIYKFRTPKDNTVTDIKDRVFRVNGES